MKKELKIKTFIVACICITGFLGGFIFGELTISDPEPREETAFDIIERIHGERNE